MFVHKKNYNKHLSREIDQNIKLSEQFLGKLEKFNVKKLNLISVGNSISAGYSKCDEIKPFLMRSNIYKLNKDIDYYSFARIRRNEEINVLKWYLNNITNTKIENLNIDDILVKQDSYVSAKWNGNTIENYKNLSKHKNIGFKDLNIDGNNIMIYNGLTGAFTNIIRKGNTKDKLKLFKAFKLDLDNFKLILTQIYIDNPDTQVYICGLPNLMGTGIISVFNKNIKRICNEIPNTVFLPGVIRSAFFYLDGQKEFDVHYNNPEYIALWNNITKAINENYISLKLKNSLISKLAKYSLNVEKESTISKGSGIEVERLIDEEIEKHIDLFKKDKKDINKTLYSVADYYDFNYLSTFSCSPREKVLTKLRKSE